MSRKTLLAVTVAAGLAAGLSACGRQGDLERPRPLIGKESQPSAAVVTRQQAADRARADGEARADPQAPMSRDEARDANLTPRERRDVQVTSDPNPPKTGSLIPDPASRPSSVPQ